MFDIRFMLIDFGIFGIKVDKEARVCAKNRSYLSIIILSKLNQKNIIEN